MAIVTVSPGDGASIPARPRVGPCGNWLRPRRLRLTAVRCMLSERELPGTGEIEGDGMGGGINCVTRD